MNGRDKRRRAKKHHSNNGTPLAPPLKQPGLHTVVAKDKVYGSPAPTPDLAKEPAPFNHSMDPDNEYAPSYKPGKEA